MWGYSAKLRLAYCNKLREMIKPWVTLIWHYFGHIYFYNQKISKNDNWSTI